MELIFTGISSFYPTKSLSAFLPLKAYIAQHTTENRPDILKMNNVI